MKFHDIKPQRVDFTLFDRLPIFCCQHRLPSQSKCNMTSHWRCVGFVILKMQGHSLGVLKKPFWVFGTRYLQANQEDTYLRWNATNPSMLFPTNQPEMSGHFGRIPKRRSFIKVPGRSCLLPPQDLSVPRLWVFSRSNREKLGGAKGKTKARLANRGWFDDLKHI